MLSVFLSIGDTDLLITAAQIQKFSNNLVCIKNKVKARNERSHVLNFDLTPGHNVWYTQWRLQRNVTFTVADVSRRRLLPIREFKINDATAATTPQHLHT